MHLYTDEGDIDTTANHPFYVIGKGWVAAGDLSEGDEVYNLDGSTSIITGYEVEKLDEPVLVYNLEVEDFHSYFVGCVPVLVHNVCNGKWEQTNEYMSDNSRAYQNSIAKAPGQSYVQNSVKFDGVDLGKDILFDCKGHYKQFINPKTGKFYSWFNGEQGFLDQAQRQIRASNGSKIEWYFQEKEVCDLVSNLFASNGINIKCIVK